MQIARKRQIHNLADFPGVTVFKRKHGAVVVAIFDSLVRLRKSRAGLIRRGRKHFLCGNVCKRPLHAAVRDGHIPKQRFLILTGHVDRVSDEVDVIRFQAFVRDEF